MSARSIAAAPLAHSRLTAVAFACACACAAVLPAFAQTTTQTAAAPSAAASANAPPVRELDARTRIGAEIARLPGGEHMGLVGLTELVSVGGQWWAGPGVYGANTGHRGGLFVPGVEGAWSHPFTDWLAVDAGLFVGGGGGAGAPVGGGLMLRPHVDLVFRLPGIYTGPTWSKVRFANGAIDSTQFGWMVNFDSSFRYRPADLLGPDTRTDGRATGLGFDRIDAVLTIERPHHSTTTTGVPMTHAIGLVGTVAEHTIAGPLWGGIEAAGAAGGGVAGYAEVLGTAGLRWPVVGDRLSLGVRGAAGLGGGGGIDTGGGLLLKGAAGANLRVTDSLSLGAEAGVARTPHGSFSARTAAVSLNWSLDAPTHRILDGWANRDTGDATRMEFGTAIETYRAARKNGPARPLEAVALQMNRFVTADVYLTGQAHSAFGGGAGAYSVGLFGVGAQWPVTSRIRLGAEALAGAAGGGGVDTQGGGILQARGYADVALTETLSLRVGGGRIKALHGGLDAPVADVALVFRFGVDSSRSR